MASTSAALPYLALRAASSAGVGGGLRGALVAIRLRHLVGAFCQERANIPLWLAVVVRRMW